MKRGMSDWEVDNEILKSNIATLQMQLEDWKFWAHRFRDALRLYAEFDRDEDAHNAIARNLLKSYGEGP